MTKIEWCDETWNPLTGCSPISEGCRNCYASRMAKRLAGRFGYDKDNPFGITWHIDKMAEPLKWRKPRRIFVCSMGDLFHEDVPEFYIDSVRRVIEIRPQHTFMLLTKRPQKMADYFTHSTVPENCWIGVTAENQKRADERLPILLGIDAPVRFVSIEPVLEDIEMKPYGALDWVICGAETGAGARPMDIRWAEHVMDFANTWGIPFFFKKASKGDIPPVILTASKEFPNET